LSNCSLRNVSLLDEIMKILSNLRISQFLIGIQGTLVLKQLVKLASHHTVFCGSFLFFQAPPLSFPIP
jgi:hypothetical protein